MPGVSSTAVARTLSVWQVCHIPSLSASLQTIHTGFPPGNSSLSQSSLCELNHITNSCDEFDTRRTTQTLVSHI